MLGAQSKPTQLPPEILIALCCLVEAGAVNFLDSDGQVCLAQMVPELILVSELTFLL